ncbi:unnamed protein product [Prorocentrum cordatum]|uniref:Uncharacterized protein n=1 Tax=Prorocentrum cordatum TaxID=2364126 RepID=A0ABN9TSU6_9DINO|nr:unnamed protein product [Polarella glacialis]
MRLLNSSSGARAVLPHPRRHRSTCHAGGSARARRPPAPQCRRGRGRTEEGRAGPGGARAHTSGSRRAGVGVRLLTPRGSLQHGALPLDLPCTAMHTSPTLGQQGRGTEEGARGERIGEDTREQTYQASGPHLEGEKKADLPSIGASPVAYGRPPGSREQFTQQAAARAEVRQPPPPWHASAGGGGGRLLAQVAARESERGETKKIQAEVIAQDTRQDTRLFRRQRPATWPPKPQGTRVPLPRDCREHGAMQGRPATPGRLY